MHRKNCPNVNSEIPSRLKRVSWNEAPEHAYQVKLQLLADDKPGMLSTITGITAASNSNIKKIELEQASQAMARVTLVFEVRDMFQLNEIIGRFKALPGIYSINRKKIGGKITVRYFLLAKYFRMRLNRFSDSFLQGGGVGLQVLLAEQLHLLLAAGDHAPTASWPSSRSCRPPA